MGLFDRYNTEKTSKVTPKKTKEQEPKITDAQLIEFSGSEEFERFKHIQPISETEINNINWEELSAQLVS